MTRKKERSKQGQTNKQGKATQHTQGSHFSKKKELPRVGLEPTTLHTLDRALYQLILYDRFNDVCRASFGVLCSSVTELLTHYCTCRCGFLQSEVKMLLQRLEEMDIPDPTDGIYKDKFSSLLCMWCVNVVLKNFIVV